jgi:hypothetical protein
VLLWETNNLGKEVTALLSRKFSLPLVLGALLLASPAFAVSKTFYLVAGSQMITNNAGGNHFVGVTGSVTLDDDGLGNVTLTDMSLAHIGSEVGLPPFISVILTRPAINLGAGSVAGTGSFATSALFGSTDIAQPGGTVLCTDGIITCASQTPPLPSGFAVPLPSPLTGVALGTWTFTGSGTQVEALFQYGPTTAGSTDTLHIIAAVPEPGTMVLVALGLVGLGIRRSRAA